MKAYLNRAYKTELRINIKLEKLETLRSLAEKTTTVLTDMPKAQNIGDPENILVKIADMETELKDEIGELLDIKSEVQETIKTLQDPELELVLDLRYLCYKTWRDIALVMSYDVRHIQRLHGEALAKLKIS